MKTLRKELLVAVLTAFCLGILISTSVVGAGNPRKSSQGTKCSDLYVKQGQKTFRLQPKGLTFITALALGPDKSGYYGIPSLPDTRLDIKPIEIWLFDPDTAGATIRLAKLAHIETAQASSFDPQAAKFGPAIFDKIYRVNYDDSLPINLWCVDRDIPLQITPVPKKPGWYRAVPQLQLEAGVYAINFGCADGPRIYTGDLYFYPFVLAGVPEPKTPPAEKPATPSQPPLCP
jgi:hypothetical protein